MIRLMLASYSKQERYRLADLLEKAQSSIECATKCADNYTDCHNCENRHICTDLLSASVYAKDYKPADN